MLNAFIEGLQDGLNDEHRTAFRTMFVTKRDVATAIALAQFYEKVREFLAAQEYGGILAEYLPIQNNEADAGHMQLLISELAELERQLPCGSSATNAG